jgi:hypothetical protein
MPRFFAVTASIVFVRRGMKRPEGRPRRAADPLHLSAEEASLDETSSDVLRREAVLPQELHDSRVRRLIAAPCGASIGLARRARARTTAAWLEETACQTRDAFRRIDLDFAIEEGSLAFTRR